MASLVKRGKQYYADFYVNGNRKRKSLRTTSHQVAKAKLRQIEQKLCEGCDDPTPSRTPTDKVLASFVGHVRAHKSPKQAQSEIGRLRLLFGEICDELKDLRRDPDATSMDEHRLKSSGRSQALVTFEAPYFESISTADVAQVIQENKRLRNWSNTTANHYRQLLIRLFNWAMEEGGLRIPGDRNPAKRVKRYRQAQPSIRYLTIPQIEEQLDALADDTQMQTMVAMYIYAGLRRSELLWLRVEDVDLASGGNTCIRVRSKVDGDDEWQSKTGIERNVSISRELRKYLDRYEGPTDPNAWLFPSPQDKRWDPDNFSKTLARRNHAAGLTWACLDYRHTFGSHLAQKGESLYKISTLMGNSPEICRKHYAAMIPEALVDIVDFHERDDENPEPTNAVADEPVTGPLLNDESQVDHGVQGIQDVHNSQEAQEPHAEHIDPATPHIIRNVDFRAVG